MLPAAFFVCLFVGIYPYAIYPAVVWVLGYILNRSVKKDDFHNPSVTIVIAAYNEADQIEATVRNKLELDYPRGLLDIIVISDESTDGTDEIVREIAAVDSRVQIRRQVPRQGKTAALNSVVPGASGDIVVFSDANSIYNRKALRRLVRNFADPEVGYVSGQMQYVNPDGSLVGDGCTAYMRYENILRAAETRLGSIVGVDGGIDASRRKLFVPMLAHQLPDFVLPLNVVEQHFRVIFEPEAILQENTLASGSAEYRMRVRVALRAFWALRDKRNLLNPFKFGRFAWQLVSHKALRYMSFLPLGLAVVLNAVLLGHGTTYTLLFLGELVFAILVLIAQFGRRDIFGIPLPGLCHYFALLNWASAIAFVMFLRGERKTLWQPRAG
jgi:cellulose synthase/poly-beta-1,6-N-acetylglucosamine synthase-like glycosyltransferase